MKSTHILMTSSDAPEVQEERGVTSIPVVTSSAQSKKMLPYRYSSSTENSSPCPENLFRASFGVLVDGSNPDDGIAIDRKLDRLFKPAFGVLVDGSNPDDGIAVERRLT